MIFAQGYLLLGTSAQVSDVAHGPLVIKKIWSTYVEKIVKFYNDFVIIVLYLEILRYFLKIITSYHSCYYL